MSCPDSGLYIRMKGGAYALISLLQGTFFAFARTSPLRSAVALLLASVTLLALWRYRGKRNALSQWVALLLFYAQMAVFIVNLIGNPEPVPFRILQLAIALFYLATMMAALLAWARLFRPAHAFVVSISVAAGLFLAEVALGLLPAESASGRQGPAVRWEGTPKPWNLPHPDLGEHYAPYSLIRTFYPGNPRGYFKAVDPRETRWKLWVGEGNVASLEFPGDDPESLRIAIKEAKTPTGSHIQLNQVGLSVKKGRTYAFNFRGRADRPRRVTFAVSKAHADWGNVGLYRDAELTCEWKTFEAEFEAVADDDNARIQFDLGGADAAVDLTNVSLRSIPEGTPIEAPIREEYFVSYRTNRLGCRGLDYLIPRPAGTIRIVVLGDSFAMGVGVHEEDTLASQLEGFLNEAAKSTQKVFEVINCGLSGYGTREERLFYKLFASRYDPEIVLLVMVWNDDLSWTDEVRFGYARRVPGKLEQFSFLYARMMKYRHQRPLPQYSGALREVHQLEGDARQTGARLAVVIFNNAPNSAWTRLVSTMKRGLQGTDIPLLVLGDALLKDHSVKDLLVYEEGGLDWHPNEIAHGIAAKEILDFLYREKLLTSP